MAAAETITVPRPKPDEVVIAVTDADGASAWVTASKATVQDADLALHLVPLLEEAQRELYKQRDGKPGA